ncbi:hypothetical protein BH20BAC1_BH20BAC1_16350 [soil metagenome]
MKGFHFISVAIIATLSMLVNISCTGDHSGPSNPMIDELALKKGNIISCGDFAQEFGTVSFQMTCNDKAKNDFNLAIKLLHSFEYEEAEKAFASVIDIDPDCAMAYWGVAMCNFHALWAPPTEAELQKGSQAIEIARSIKDKTDRESAYINAIAQIYTDWDKTSHSIRCAKYESEMEKLYKDYPDDKEAAIFYALSIDAAADPNDQSFIKQKKAGSILNALYPSEPDHPGIIHYIIHTYDYPGLAELALPAARKYAKVAPSSAHAMHMPSHIFTRLGLWDECISANLASMAAAKCYAEQADIKGHWDEELHGMDYLVYAYLQKGDNKLAKEQLQNLKTIIEVYPANFKVAYAFAAIPSRYFLENKNWDEAAKLKLYPADFPWVKFPWQKALFHFTRLIGNAYTGNIQSAKSELANLEQLRDTLQKQKDSYKTKQLDIQITTGKAWIEYKSGNREGGFSLMRFAADMEDSIQKHPVTPGEVLPAREMLGDMMFQSGKFKNALQSYEAVLQKCPNRFNSLYGAGLTAEKLGDTKKAAFYFTQLSKMISETNVQRPEITHARNFLANSNQVL